MKKLKSKKKELQKEKSIIVRRKVIKKKEIKKVNNKSNQKDMEKKVFKIIAFAVEQVLKLCKDSKR